MKALLLPCLLLALTLPATAQTSATAEAQAIQKTIQTLFDGMRRGDSTMVRSVLIAEARFTTVVSRNGNVRPVSRGAKDFLVSIGTPGKEALDERLTGTPQIQVDGELASVWSAYEFYVGSKLSHCGTDSFQLIKLSQGWRISAITWTIRKDGCK
jgi:hypothetical protein